LEHAADQHHLCLCLAQGWGVPVDSIDATKALKLASDHNLVTTDNFWMKGDDNRIRLSKSQSAATRNWACKISVLFRVKRTSVSFIK
jgi:hypothetical protein